MNPESTFSSVVLPAPVPPEISMLSRPLTMAESNFQHGLGQGLVLDHVAGGDGIATEAADGEAGTIDAPAAE